MTALQASRACKNAAVKMLLENAEPKGDAYVMKTVCKFCNKYGEIDRQSQIADHVLFESENFVVVPSIGSIVPGWLLVVPRAHFLSVGSFDAAIFEEFGGIQETARQALQDCFGPVVLFEHGAVREQESVGCGIDHAHLHMVATDLDIVNGVKLLAKEQLSWFPVSGIQAASRFVAKHLPYVFVQQTPDSAWIGSASSIESQLIRKVIANYEGLPGCWDWKAHPFERNVEETVTRLEAWKSARSQLASVA